MNSNTGFNNIKSNNAEQLRPKQYYSPNSIGKFENKVNTQPKYVEPNTAQPTQTVEKPKEKSKVISKILTTVVAVVTATAIGVTNIDGLLLPSTTLVAYFEELEATEHEINYGIWIEDSRVKEDEPYEEDFDLSNVYIVLTNDFTNRTEKVEEQWWSGTFEGLKDNMMYTISVMVGDTVIATKMIKTSAERQTSSDDPTNIGGG